MLVVACQPVDNPTYPALSTSDNTIEFVDEEASQTQVATLAPANTTPVIEPVKPKITPTNTPEVVASQPAATKSLPDYGIYTFIYESGYSFWSWNGKSMGIAVHMDSHLSSDPNPTMLGAGDALYLIFANFANKMAYWTVGRPGELWITDLQIQTPQKIYVDEELKYPTDSSFYPGYDVNLIWTPDDSYLLVEVPSNPQFNLIYNDRTKILDSWDYTCDRVAFSPHTNQLATWCAKNGGENEFAIIEWGGEISYTNAKPQKELVRRGDDFQQIWAWSADGSRIAYFDPNDPQGELSILSSSGEILVKTLTGGAYWKALQPGVSKGQIDPPSPPLQWSENGERLVVYANGTIDHPCPPFIDDITGKRFENVPCWQVIDTQTGEVIWTVMDAIKSTPDELHIEYIKPWSFDVPTISADGKLLVICYRYFGYRSLFIIELASKDTVWSEDFVVDNMRWGIAP